MSQKLDIILYGATGFTGKLVAEYFVTRYMDSGVSFGIAGRTITKLADVVDKLCEINPEAKNIKIIRCDSNDDELVDQMVQSARVIVTTVGPYRKYGTKIIQKCAEHGVDYIDLTAELPWVRQMMQSHHDIAVKKGARIINACGFDSIPSDLTSMTTIKFMREKHGDGKITMTNYFKMINGAFSGGTVASSIDTVTAPDPNKDTWKNPYSLFPPGVPKGTGSKPKSPFFQYNAYLRAYTYPFIMASANIRIVYRSNALANFLGGRDLTYSEVSYTSSYFKAVTTTLVLAFFDMLMTYAPTWLVMKFLPAPGEGPTREQMMSARFITNCMGKLEKPGGQVVNTLCRMTMEGDPGYLATSKMLLECGMALVQNRNELSDTLGFVTPAIAFGDVLVDRLKNTGVVEFEMVEI